MADPDHVSLARAGASAIARWRELTFRSPNTRLLRFDLGYRLEDRAASETFTPEFNYGRPSLDLSGSFLSNVKLASADLRRDDLSGADLTGADLRMADLSGANLTGAHLFRATMPRATLTGAQLGGCSLGRANLSHTTMIQAQMKAADLSYASLSYADLEGADLSGTDLTSTDLSWANLTGADLRGASLTATTLMMANLTGADLREARVVKSNMDSAVFLRARAGGTLFANCDMSSAIGLETLVHSAPSTIAVDTLSRSGGRIPRAFLRGAGVAEPLVAAQEAMTNERRTYPTVLIVTCKGDAELAKQLREALRGEMIPTWILKADDEDALNSGDSSLDFVVHFDRLALLCTDAALENPLASRYFAELVRSSGRGTGSPLAALGFGESFYERQDRLCNGLRQGDALDFRGWSDAGERERAVAALVRLLTAPEF